MDNFFLLPYLIKNAVRPDSSSPQIALSFYFLYIPGVRIKISIFKNCDNPRKIFFGKFPKFFINTLINFK